MIASTLLDKGGFGIFYGAILAISVFMAPASAAMFPLSRHLTEQYVQHGPERMAQAVRNIFLWLLVIGAPFAILVALVLTVVTYTLKASAWTVALLVPLCSIALISTEILRFGFQSSHRFSISSKLWITSQGLQLLFAIAGLYIAQAVWAGLVGILIGTTIALVAFTKSLGPGSLETPTFQVTTAFSNEIRAILSYTLFTLFSNLDVFIGYWVLPQPIFDDYAAAALLPKALVTASLPISQVAIAVIVSERVHQNSVWVLLIKSIGLFVVVGLLLLFTLSVGAPLMSKIPLKALQFNMNVATSLTFAAIAVGCLRILVVVEVGLRRHRAVYLQFATIILFPCFWVLKGNTAIELAQLYGTVALLCTLSAAGFILPHCTGD